MYIRQRTFFTALNHIQQKKQQGFLKNLFSSVTFSANTEKSLISSSTSISFHRNLSEQRQQSVLSLLKKNKNYSTSSPVMTASGKEIRESFSADKEFFGTDVEGAMEALAKADAVCFDVDSTVITEEGIVSSFLLSILVFKVHCLLYILLIYAKSIFYYRMF